jgi:hypothetical protein
MRIAGRLAQEFFMDIRDGLADQSYDELDPLAQKKYGRSLTIKILQSQRMFLRGTVLDEKYTFVVRNRPLEALSCVEAKSKSRKLYLAARLIRRGPDASDWRVQGFKVTSVPEKGCPT